MGTRCESHRKEGLLSTPTNQKKKIDSDCEKVKYNSCNGLCSGRTKKRSTESLSKVSKYNSFARTIKNYFHPLFEKFNLRMDSTCIVFNQLYKLFSV